jgi:ABC-type nitrate/sulfonate/bicarbonate transport system permease component
VPTTGVEAGVPPPAAPAALRRTRSGARTNSRPGARLGNALAPLVLPVLLLVAWQVLATLGWLPGFLASPLVIVEQFATLLFTGELLVHARDSLWRSLAGFALAAAFGAGLGLLAGVSRRVGGFFDPLISLTYPVPKIALLPILIVWFGISDTSKILVIMISCFYPCFIAALYGVRATEQGWVWAAQNMGASPAQIFFKVIVPAAAPQIFTGLRVALALAFILMFSSEMIGSSNRTGLGYVILSADAAGRFDRVYAAVAAIALLGFASDRLLLWLRDRLLVGQLVAERRHE